MDSSTITITFGEQVENHVGMQKLGQLGDTGLSCDDLEEAQKLFEKKGLKCELIRLNDLLDADRAEGEGEGGGTEVTEASVLIVKNGVQAFNVNPDELFQEQSALEWDSKAFMYGRVVNKRARYNLCYADEAQEPDYPNKKGRVIAYSDIPLTKTIRGGLHTFFGEQRRGLKAEGNYYYDSKKCGIGWHGDSERKIVIAVRLGATIDLRYQWYHLNQRVGKMAQINVEHGDLYAMSEKATGHDWKKRKIYTLRHSAGCKQYTK